MDDATDTELLIEAIRQALTQRLEKVETLADAFSAAWSEVRNLTVQPIHLLLNYPELLDYPVSGTDFFEVATGRDALIKIVERALHRALSPVVDDWVTAGLRDRLRETCIDVLEYTISLRDHHAAGLVSETTVAEMQDAIEEIADHGTVGQETRKALADSMGALRKLLLVPNGKAVASLGGADVVTLAHDRAHCVFHLLFFDPDRFASMLADEHPQPSLVL